MPRQERFDIPRENMMSPKTQADILKARKKIRIAQKREMGCSERCELVDLGHSEDCPNRNRYDVI